MRVTRAAEPSDDWLRLVESVGRFYLHPLWVTGIGECFDFAVHCLEARGEDGTLEGVLALAEVPGFPGLAPKRLVSFPFSYAAGTVCRGGEAHSALNSYARSLVEESGSKILEIKQPNTDVPVADGFTRLQHYCTYRVATDGGADAIWEQLNASSTRRGIRKAKKSDLVVERAESEADWEVMHILQSDTAAGHGVPPPPRRFFVAHCRRLQAAGLADLYLARAGDGVPVAGIVVWRGRAEWIYAFGASRKEHLDKRPNHLLIWTAMQDAAAAGAIFDLGRAAPEQAGLVDFKLRWGGVPVPLAYDYWPRPDGLNVRPRDEGRLGFGARLWARLPVGLTRAAAPLYRYLG